MTAQPTREDLVAAVSTALQRLAEAQTSGYVPGSIRGAIRRATQRLAVAEAALQNHDDAADWAIVRALMDACDVEWEWEPGKYYCHLPGDSCDAEPCGTGATRSAAMLDLARKVAARDTKPAGEAGEETESSE